MVGSRILAAFCCGVTLVYADAFASPITLTAIGTTHSKSIVNAELQDAIPNGAVAQLTAVFDSLAPDQCADVIYGCYDVVSVTATFAGETYTSSTAAATSAATPTALTLRNNYGEGPPHPFSQDTWLLYLTNAVGRTFSGAPTPILIELGMVDDTASVLTSDGLLPSFRALSAFRGSSLSLIFGEGGGRVYASIDSVHVEGLPVEGLPVAAVPDRTATALTLIIGMAALAVGRRHRLMRPR